MTLLKSSMKIFDWECHMKVVQIKHILNLLQVKE